MVDWQHTVLGTLTEPQISCMLLRIICTWLLLLLVHTSIKNTCTCGFTTFSRSDRLSFLMRKKWCCMWHNVLVFKMALCWMEFCTCAEACCNNFTFNIEHTHFEIFYTALIINISIVTHSPEFWEHRTYYYYKSKNISVHWQNM